MQEKLENNVPTSAFFIIGFFVCCVASAGVKDDLDQKHLCRCLMFGFLSPADAPKQKLIKKSFRISWHLWSISYIVWFRGFPLLPHSVLNGILLRINISENDPCTYFVFSVSCYHRLENRCVTFPIWKFSLGVFRPVGAAEKKKSKLP